jgi:squalene-associated FAD-dependent desaturase
VKTVAVVGGGWAGCAAALALAARGRRVALYEAAATLGGRARRVVIDGLPLDNGQHLLLGAYVETRRAIALARAPSAAPLALAPLAIAPFAADQPLALALRTRRLPAPYGLLAGLLGASGLSLRSRVATALWMARLRRSAYACGRETTVASLLAGLPAEAAEKLWAPLCVAALNTLPREASAQAFLDTLRAAFDGAREGSDLVVHGTDLSALFPEPAARRLAADGHEVRMQSAARIVKAADGRLTLVAQGEERPVAAAVVAVGPHQLARAFAPETAAGDAAIAAALALTGRLAYEPIVTVYLGYAGHVPLPAGLVRLDDAPGQWIFDRRDILARAARDAPAWPTLLAVVISAHGPHNSLARDALVAAVDGQLRRLRADMPQLAWSRVIAERRATYACRPGAARPRAGRLSAGLYLAGDYTDADFPATLEAAVASGRRAADALCADGAG